MPKPLAATFERDVPVTMRDGVTLYADVYRPQEPGRYPVLVQRTPYSKDGTAVFALRAVGEGYAVVVQDVRGRWTSEGEFRPFFQEQADGADTIAWAAGQDWSNGRVGTFGGSYVGVTQWQAAIGGAPALQAMAVSVTAADYHDGWTYQGGAFSLNFNLSWTASLVMDTFERRKSEFAEATGTLDRLYDQRDRLDLAFAQTDLGGDALLTELAPYYADWLRHPSQDEFWQQINVADRYANFDFAGLHLGGWYDIFLGGTLTNFVGMRRQAKTAQARAAQHLIVGPWSHATMGNGSPVGEVSFGVRADPGTLDLNGIQLRWFDRWLRDVDNGFEREPPVRIFVMGTNVWREEQSWPLERAQQTALYLHSDGRANSLQGDGVLSRAEPTGERPDHYLYNPLDPVPTIGGALCCSSTWSKSGAFDQRPVETRSDVLVYTSEPLAAPLEVTGPVSVRLFAASSAVDTDFTAKLVDVSPCGYARNLTDSIIRARYRKSPRQPSLLDPGEIAEYEIDLWATSNVFLPGHRIRLEIASSNFPRFDRNPNTGTEPGEPVEPIPAHQTIFHDREHPSRLILPIVDDPPGQN